MGTIPKQRGNEETIRLTTLRRQVVRELYEALAITDGLGTWDDPPVLRLIIPHPHLSIQDACLIKGRPVLVRWDASSVADWARGKTDATASSESVDLTQLTRDECDMYLQYFAGLRATS